jgi:chromosome segregation ATPase
LSAQRVSDLQSFCKDKAGLTNEQDKFSDALKSILENIEKKNDDKPIIPLPEPSSSKAPTSIEKKLGELTQENKDLKAEQEKQRNRLRVFEERDAREKQKLKEEQEKRLRELEERDAREKQMFQEQLSSLKAIVHENQKNIAKNARRIGCNETSIENLKTFHDMLKTEMMEGCENENEELEKLSRYKKVLDMLAQPESIKVIHNILEEHHTQKDHHDDMEALRHHLLDDPKLSDSPNKIRRIMDFSQNYHEAFMCLYNMSPMLASGVVTSSVGRESMTKKCLLILQKYLQLF